MFKKIMLVGIAASVVALGAPSAYAHHRWDCGFTSASQGTVTGDQSYEGEIHAWVVGNPDEAVSIRCWLVVGTTTGPGITVSGTTHAEGAERVSFTAEEGEVVYACYTATAGSHTVSDCDEADHTEFPPPVFWEIIDGIFEDLGPVFDDINDVVMLLDPATCAELKKYKGVYYPVGIDNEGDVFYDFNGDGDFDDDEWVWDCPKYFADDDVADGGGWDYP